MRPVFVDTSVLLVAVGGEHQDRAECRRLMQSAADGTIRLHASVEVGQEFLFHRLRRVAPTVAIAQFDALSALMVWHAFDLDVLRASRDFVAAGYARGHDAVLAATAFVAGFDEIVSLDHDFDGIPGLHRRGPGEALAARQG